MEAEFSNRKIDASTHKLAELALQSFTEIIGPFPPCFRVDFSVVTVDLRNPGAGGRWSPA